MKNKILICFEKLLKTVHFSFENCRDQLPLALFDLNINSLIRKAMPSLKDNRTYNKILDFDWFRVRLFVA